MTTENNNIIEFILAEQEKSKAENRIQANGNKTVIDDRSFFMDNSTFGITTKLDFLNAVHSRNKTQLKAIETLFIIMGEHKKINTSTFAQIDKKGDEYYWIKIYGNNGATEFKLSSFPGLDKLMQGYLFNMYLVKASFTNLYNEAKSTSEQ